MTYVDLRPRKVRGKKNMETEVSGVASTPIGTDSTATTGDFFSSFAEVGKQEQSVEANKSDVIEILNILNEKLSSVEEKLYRLERKIDEKI